MQQVVDIRRQSLEQAGSHLGDVQEKHRHGTASRFSLLRAQVEVKNREPELIGAENDLALSMQDLKRVVGLDGEPDPVLTDALEYIPVHVEADEAVSEAMTWRPEILSLELNVDGRQRILDIERAGMLPTIGLYGQILMQGQAKKNNLTGPFYEDSRAISTSAGIALRIPLFDGFRTKGKVQQARASLRRAERERDQVRKAIHLEVTKAVQDLESLRQEHESQLATVALAEEAYEIAEARFRNGLSTQLELNDAETALDFARTNFAETLYRYNVAVANLERVLGRTSQRAVNSDEE
jgi:outer membrane protein TolC